MDQRQRRAEAESFDVLGHLIDGELTDWMGRARVVQRRVHDRRFVPFDRFRRIERNRGA
jgi:hypothetical protein